MSTEQNIASLIKSWGKKYKWSRRETAENLLSVLGTLQYTPLTDTPFSSDDYDKNELEAAKKLLRRA